MRWKSVVGEAAAALRGGFVRNVTMLASGTILAQLIVLLASPLVSRLYEPEAFGLLGVYISVVATVSVIAALRYDLAVPLPGDDEDALAVLRLALSIVALIVGAVSVGVWAAGDRLINLLNADHLRPYRWLIPIGIALIGMYSTFTSWAVRVGAFRRIARTRLSQAVANTSLQVGLGLLGVGPAGLLIGDVAGRSVGILTLSRGLWDRLRTVSPSRIRMVAARYKRFPMVTSVSDFVNTAGLQLPVLLLSSLFGPASAGSFLLMQRVMGVPVGLLGDAIGQVYLNRAARLKREDPGRLRPLYLRTAAALAGIGALPLTIAAFVGPPLIPIIFGPAWNEAATLVRPLGLMHAAALVMAPLSQTLGVVLERQLWQLAWDVARLLVVFATLWGSASGGLSLRSAISVYSIGMSVMYGLHLILTLLAIRAEARREATGVEAVL